MASQQRTAKVEAQLAAAESELRAQLLRLLPSGTARGVDLFTNSEFNQYPQRIVRPNPDAEALLAAARHCLALRASLALPIEGSLAHAYLSACAESASLSEHRRGPRRLAEAVLARAQHNAV
jgi:hypothetical protein